MVLGVEAMHSLPQPVSHRDIKAENVLLGDDGHYKFATPNKPTTFALPCTQTVRLRQRQHVQQGMRIAAALMRGRVTVTRARCRCCTTSAT